MTLTLVEFIEPLTASSHQNRILAVLYYKTRYENAESLTVEEIRAGLRAARTLAWNRVNIADVLAKSGANVDSPGNKGKARLWKLTDTGARYVRKLLNLPEPELVIQSDVTTLTVLAAKLKDTEIRDYVDEAITCLRAGALRASVVFLWSGAMRVIQNALVDLNDLPGLNAALQKHDPKVREVKRLDHFAYVKDETIRLAAIDLAIFDKAQGDILKEALGLRNKSGHPGKYKLGEKKVSAFIEDMISVVFS